MTREDLHRILRERVPSLTPVQREQVCNAVLAALSQHAEPVEGSTDREIFDAGFRTAVIYGDNHLHYGGEQADAVFEREMAKLKAISEAFPLPPTPPAPPAGERFCGYVAQLGEPLYRPAATAELQAKVERLEGDCTNLRSAGAAELTALQSQLANVTEIRQTLDAHICEACEMLGLDRHEVPCDSWTLREKIASVMKQLAAKGEEVERKLWAWVFKNTALNDDSCKSIAAEARRIVEGK